ncbi:MAG: ABC transporter permease [Candidatus Geothermarchaeales archaeon]
MTRWQTFRRSISPKVKEFKFTLHKIRQNPLSIAGLALIFFFVVLAILAPYLIEMVTPHLAPGPGDDPYEIPRDSFEQTPQPPSPEHPWGTTQGQYDIFYGIMMGTRTAFRVGLFVVGLAIVIGIVLGAVAGYYGGAIDEVIMRTVDIFLAFPALILALAIVTVLGTGIDNVMIAVAAVWWPSYVRLIRGDILSVREESYVEAAKAVGARDSRIMFRHIIPNAIYPLLVLASMDIGSVVLVAAALSFLGLGAGESYADWGGMISIARNWITGLPGNPYAFWYTVTIPGVFIFLFVLGWNLLGDAFRDIIDPKVRRR